MVDGTGKGFLAMGKVGAAFDLAASVSCRRGRVSTSYSQYEYQLLTVGMVIFCCMMDG